jgi:hypothetical protein
VIMYHPVIVSSSRLRKRVRAMVQLLNYRKTSRPTDYAKVCKEIDALTRDLIERGLDLPMPPPRKERGPIARFVQGLKSHFFN